MKKIIFVFCLSILAWPIYAVEGVSLLQARLNQIKTFTADFDQQVVAKKRNLAESSGKMSLSRPGKFRWETKEPMEQLVIADGNKIWVYDVDLEQVSVKKQSEGMGGAAGLFLSKDNQQVARDFIVNLEKNGSIEQYDLKAKSNKANFQRVILEFEKNQLKKIELFDQLGQHTFVSFNHIKINPPLSPKEFKFNIPKGVDLVEQ